MHFSYIKLIRTLTEKTCRRKHKACLPGSLSNMSCSNRVKYSKAVLETLKSWGNFKKKKKKEKPNLKGGLSFSDKLEC